LTLASVHQLPSAVPLPSAPRQQSPQLLQGLLSKQEHYLMLKSRAEGNAAMKRLSKVLERKMAKKARR
jgi:hypothetical protein